MRFYLVQHGLACDGPDPGLSDVGLEDVEKIAEVARMYGVPVSKIVHSGKRRAAETAIRLGEVLQPEGGVEAVVGLSPQDETLDVELRFASETLIVGHLPFLDRMLSRMVSGDADAHVFAFQNAGIVCVEKGEDGWAVVWTLMPNIG